MAGMAPSRTSGEQTVLEGAVEERGSAMDFSTGTETPSDDVSTRVARTWNENVWLASRGGGIGTYWGRVRGIGEPVGLNGKTSGIIPFVRVMDSLTLAISQGSLRRGSAACYLDISHPEIEEFLEIRKPSGDFNRTALNLHHGVLVTDELMEAVREGAEFILRSPKDGSERATVDARSLFQKLVEDRKSTRLNSSHLGISYAVFCLKKKNTTWFFLGNSCISKPLSSETIDYFEFYIILTDC